jgi:DNA-binding MarR family transcriptional regulator
VYHAGKWSKAAVRKLPAAVMAGLDPAFHALDFKRDQDVKARAGTTSQILRPVVSGGAEDGMMEQPGEVTEQLEQAFAFLARALEAINRKRAYPLERAHYLLLLRLRQGPASVSALAASLALDDSTVTRQVAAMQRLGLVRKLVNPDDGRSALIEPTQEGAARAEAMRTERLQRIEALFDGWPEADRAQLALLLGRVNRQLARTLALIDAERGESRPEPGSDAPKGA